MKLHRFIYNFDVTEQKLRVADKELINQINNVLRLKKEDLVIFINGKGDEAEAKLVSLKYKYADFKLINIFKNNTEIGTHVTLYCSILKRENFELVVQKSTEVGIKEIIPVIANRTVKLNLKKERLNKIIQEAVEQSGGRIVPKLNDPLYIDEAMRLAKKNNQLNLFFDICGAEFDSNAPLGKLMGRNKKIGIFIGPEGGWNKEEVTSAKKADFIIVSLGKLTLRAETAAIVATYLAAGNIR